jgi:hypothetical protein
MKNLDYWGIRDWDQHLFYFESSIRVIKEYGQLPLWNPWYQGGMVLFQNAQIIFLTPFTLLLCFLDTPAAIKVSILVHYIIALCGMYVVASRLFHIQRVFFVLLGAAVYVFNSSFSLHFTEGHTTLLTFAYIPWVYYFFESYVKTKKALFLISSSIGISLMIFEGGTFSTPFLILFLGCYAIFRFLLYFDRAYLIGLIDIGITSFLLAAIKVIPLMDYMLANPRYMGGYERIPFAALIPIFFGREQVLGLELFDQQIWGWHEYGCYIGYILFLVLCAAIVYAVRHIKSKPSSTCLLLCLGTFFLFFLGGDLNGFAPYALLRKLPVFSSMRVTGRFLLIITFISSLLIFQLFEYLETRIKGLSKNYRKVAVITTAIVTIVVYFDLFGVNTKAFNQAFTINPNNISFYKDKFEKPFEYRYVKRLPSYGTRSSMYAGLRMNIATIWGYEPNTPKRGFVLGEKLVFSENKNVIISNIIFTPNKVTFDADVPVKSTIFLNQNYVRGWKAGGALGKVENINRKPGARVSQGYYEGLSFYYMPNSIYIGLIITVCGIIFCFLLKQSKVRLFLCK